MRIHCNNITERARRLQHAVIMACSVLIPSTMLAQCFTNEVTLEFQTDGNPGETTWEIEDALTSSVVANGGPLSAPNSIETTTACLPDGCYRLRVLDSAGDGMTTGGYVLRTTGSDLRIIDNANNFSTGSVSAIAAGGTFCVPLGTIDLIFSSCDKLDWVNYKYLVCHADPAVSAEWVPSGANNVQDANSGYEFWIFDPNGTYSYRKFRPHNVSDGFSPATAYRAAHMKLNAWYNTALTPIIPQNVLMNVRVRGRVNGVNQEFGPACTMMMDNARAACPSTHLQDDPSSNFSSNFSCGETRTFGGGSSWSNRITAVPAQIWPVVSASLVRYQFRFRIPGEGVCIIRPPQSNPTLTMNWTTGQLLECNKSYLVDVRISKDAGATWCFDTPSPSCTEPVTPWGLVCFVNISSSTFCPNPLVGGSSNMSQGNGALTMYPNPNNGAQLTIALSEVAIDVRTVSVDLFDLMGKRVAARTVAVQDGFVKTVLDLNNELSNGLYMVNITAGEKTYTERLVIQK